MPQTMYDILHPHAENESDLIFKNAPEGWTTADAEDVAARFNITLLDEHWEAIRVLHGAFRDEVAPTARLLHDALIARFQKQGGSKYLFTLFPGGPIAQGCRLAGLRPPSGSTSLAFGSVR